MPDRTRVHRRQLALLRLTTLREYLRLWPLLNPAELDRTFPGYAVAVARLIGDQREVAAALARQYVSAVRSDTRVPGHPPTIPTPRLSPEQMATAVRVTAVVSIKAATANGQTLTESSQAAFVRSSGAVTRLVDDAARRTVMASVYADPYASGWQRSVSSGCDFCQMLAGRGAVYSEDTADFAAHDHCSCSAEPVYDR